MPPRSDAPRTFADIVLDAIGTTWSTLRLARELAAECGAAGALPPAAPAGAHARNDDVARDAPFDRLLPR